jgi:hypothetical protein
MAAAMFIQRCKRSPKRVLKLSFLEIEALF